MSAIDRSRRELALTAGAAVAAAALPFVARSEDAFAQATDDVSTLQALLGLELAAVTAYQRSQSQLGGVARLFRNQDRQHAAALTAALRQMGAKPTATVDASVLSGLSAAGSRRSRAQFAIGLEDAAVRAYQAAHRNLRDASLMQLATTILGNQAQHLVVLRQIAGRAPVPGAFERGSS